MSDILSFRILIKKDYSLHAIIMSAALLALSFFYAGKYFAYASFVIGFSAFDVLGFRHVLDGRDGVPRAAYRFVQTSFQIIFIIFLYTYFGWQVAAASLVAWWFCLCDLLFYYFSKIPLDSHYTWLNWSALGFIKLFKPSFRIGKFAFVVSALLGNILAMCIIYYLKN